MSNRRNLPVRSALRAVVLALPLAFVAPASALAICGDTVVDMDEECDDGNVSDGDCCSASCLYELDGASCADDGEVCTTDLCDGAGACVHAAGNAGTECREDGRKEGLGSVAAGELELPVAIASAWFETHECGDGSTIQFYPQGGATCTGWHTYTTAPGSAANLKSKVDGMVAGTYTPPAATAGSTTFNLVSGTISSAISSIRNLYNANRAANGEWTVRVPVFDASGVCSNFVSSLQIVGFATVRITMDANNTIDGYVDCVTTTGTAGLADFGTVVGTDEECDVPESCDGLSTTCPADAHEPAGTACAADSSICTIDVCDSSGVCNHSGGNVGTVCRPSAGVCDPAETCTGGITCPADGKSTAVCRAAGGVCDLAETCNGTANACPADAKRTTTCRPSAGVCDPAAETCNGVSDACPADALASAATTCRNAAGVCDVAETCTGTSAACPADAKRTTTCRPSAGVCDPAAETCNGVSDTCPADSLASAATTCRNAAGVCDVAETCTGASAACPADAKSTATCRPSAGVCDPAAETCNGVSDACPADALASAATTCRNAAGVCDVAETCTGASAACPVDAKSTATCRPSAGVCDPAAETCNGVSDACPADALASAATTCRNAAGVCDVTETCTGTSAACPADAKSTAECRASGGVCDIAETCDGLASACPADAKRSGTCRNAAGVCDTSESCDGVANACPVDSFRTTGTECRASGGVCDIAETCTGTSAACPANAFASGATCRNAAGVCDVAETCSAGVATCPADAFASGSTCRSSAGICDVAETCSGASAVCPADAFAVGAVCRESIGECDVAETCTAGSPACPANGIAPSGTPCGDPRPRTCSAPDTCDDLGVCDENNVLPGTSCEDDFPCTTGDTCSPYGVCHAGAFPACDDDNPCTANECEPETGECTFDVRPADGCKGAGKSGLSISTRGDGKAKWKWNRGEETSCDELGSPDAHTDYDVCIYDGTGGGTYELAAHFALPASGLWQRASSCRWTYKDRSGATDGITGMKLTPRDAGRASIQISAEGEAAPLPAPVAADRFMVSDPDVRVQILNSGGACWESRLTEGRRNSGDSYKGAGVAE